MNSQDFYLAAVALEVQLSDDSTEQEIETIKEKANNLLDELEESGLNDFDAKEARKNLMDTIYWHKIPQICQTHSESTDKEINTI